MEKLSKDNQILKGKVCPYCGSGSKYIDSKGKVERGINKESSIT